jgi:hypothetical protein
MLIHCRESSHRLVYEMKPWSSQLGLDPNACHELHK